MTEEPAYLLRTVIVVNWETSICLFVTTYSALPIVLFHHCIVLLDGESIRPTKMLSSRVAWAVRLCKLLSLTRLLSIGMAFAPSP